MSRTPLSTMRRISRACASQSTCPSGPNGVTGIAATVARAPRSWSAAPGSKLIGIPSGWPRPPLAPTLGHARGTSAGRVTEGSFADVAHDVLDTGVVLEAVHGQVLAVPGVLEAAVGHLGHERNMGVDPDRPEVELAGRPHRPAVILRPHAGGQPVLDPVRPAQCLLLSREALHGDHRAEDLLLDHLVVLAQAGHHGGGETVAALPHRNAAGHHLGVVRAPGQEALDPASWVGLFSGP